MTVHGIGIDVVEVARIATAIARHGEAILARLFTPAERAYCDTKKIPSIHYAARFAAKEAVAKALGTGIGAHANWLDLEVTHGPGGVPALGLHGAAAAYASAHGICDIQISLTHTHAHAAANAIALKEDKQGLSLSEPGLISDVGGGIFRRGCQPAEPLLHPPL